MRAIDNTDARYVRAGGKGSIRIRYRRLGVGRPGKRLDAKMRRKIARIAYMICMLAPDEADTILQLPSRRVGRMFKATLRRTQKAVHMRRFPRRPASCVLRA